MRQNEWFGSNPESRYCNIPVPLALVRIKGISPKLERGVEKKGGSVTVFHE